MISPGYAWQKLVIMWSKVLAGLLVVNIVILAIWLALTESGSNGGGEVGKEGCLHVKQVIFQLNLSFFLFAILSQGTRLEFEAGQLICVGGCQLAPELPELLCTWGEIEVPASSRVKTVLLSSYRCPISFSRPCMGEFLSPVTFPLALSSSWRKSTWLLVMMTKAFSSRPLH